MSLTVTLDEAAHGALDRLEQKTGSSRDWLVSRAVEAFAAYDAWQVDKIEPGLAAADRGDFATDDEVGWPNFCKWVGLDEWQAHASLSCRQRRSLFHIEC